VLWEVSLLGQTIDVMKQGGKEDELITYLWCAFHLYKLCMGVSFKISSQIMY
jgi:hypothetical protein